MTSKDDAGLTLVEMLVVLAVIGVMGSVAVLGLGASDRSSSAQAEAQRLAASIQFAADEAMLSDQPAALGWDDGAYWFVEWNPERREWQAHDRADLGKRHELPEQMSLSGNSPRRPVAIGDGSPDSALAFTLAGGSRSWRVRFDGLNAVVEPNS